MGPAWLCAKIAPELLAQYKQVIQVRSCQQSSQTVRLAKAPPNFRCEKAKITRKLVASACSCFRHACHKTTVEKTTKTTKHSNMIINCLSASDAGNTFGMQRAPLFMSVLAELHRVGLLYFKQGANSETKYSVMYLLCLGASLLVDISYEQSSNTQDIRY